VRVDLAARCVGRRKRSHFDIGRSGSLSRQKVVAETCDEVSRNEGTAADITHSWRAMAMAKAQAGPVRRAFVMPTDGLTKRLQMEPRWSVDGADQPRLVSIAVSSNERHCSFGRTVEAAEGAGRVRMKGSRARQTIVSMMGVDRLDLPNGDAYLNGEKEGGEKLVI
jgi:hypothetical protein